MRLTEWVFDQLATSVKILQLVIDDSRESRSPSVAMNEIWPLWLFKALNAPFCLAPRRLLPAAIIGKISICPFCPCPSVVMAKLDQGSRIPGQKRRTNETVGAFAICHSGTRDECVWRVAEGTGPGARPPIETFAFGGAFPQFSTRFPTSRAPDPPLFHRHLTATPHDVAYFAARAPVNNVRRNCRLSMVEILMANCADVSIYLLYE